MHKKLIKKYADGDPITPSTNTSTVYGGMPSWVYNGIMGALQLHLLYASSGSTGVNSNIGNIMKSGAVGSAITSAGGIAGLMIGGEAGNAIGTIAGNLGSNILSAGNVSLGLKNFSKFNVKGFGTKDFKGFGNLGNLAGGIATGILDRSASHQRTSGKYGTLAAGTDMVGGLIGNLGHFGGYGVLGSLGMAISNKITGGTDGMTIADSVLGSSALAGGLTAINPILGAAYVGLSTINSATGKTTTKNENNDYFSRENLASLWGSYNKSYADHKNALKYGNKKYGGISVLTGSFGRADRKVVNDNRRVNTLLDIYDLTEIGKIRGQQMADINALDYRLNTFGGYDLYGTRIGRKGMKLPTKLDTDKIRNILSCKKGGQMSVIPEGALHARKNHMEGAGKDYTHKGIPVMDKDGEQLAEIERDEIIFSLRVTQKLERLKNDGSDEAAIKAGKLLVDEIFHNTDDRTGLIQEIIGQETTIFKEGGILIAEEPEIESGIEAEEPVIEEIEYYQKGGKKALFVKDIYNPSIRTEGDIIYNADTKELKHHEYSGHFNLNEKLLKDLEPYWKDLNDEKLINLGADLNFVKRINGDPNFFFNPEEVLGRVEAAKVMLGDDMYRISPDFFRKLKEVDENKYGDNMRDLLHMYNPEILNEIFTHARKYLTPRLEQGGIIEAEEPSNDEEEIEEFQKGGKPHWDKSMMETKPFLFVLWLQGVNPKFLSTDYDLESAFKYLPFDQLERWKWATNLLDPEYYMNYQDENGDFIYHLGSVAELPNGDYMFLKLGKEDTNPELHFETDLYHSGKNGYKLTHDLKFEGDRYYYRKKKTSKKK